MPKSKAKALAMISAAVAGVLFWRRKKNDDQAGDEPSDDEPRLGDVG